MATCPFAATGPPCGPADADGDIRQRIQTNGRCEAAIERGDTYGPAVYLAYVPATAVVRLERPLGCAARRARDGDRLRPADAARPRPRRPALRRPVARGRTRVRVGGLPVHRLHPELEHERHDHAGRARVGLLAGELALGPRRCDCPCRVGEVRRTPRRAALGDVSGRRNPTRCSSLPRRLCARERGRVLDPPARTRTWSTPCAPSASERSGSSSTASRRSRSGTGASTTPGEFPTCPRCRRCCRSA